jgi:hypothetical protein
MWPIQGPQSCLPHSADDAVNRGRVEQEPPQNWDYQGLRSDMSQGYTHFAAGSCNREISGNYVSEGQIW